MGKSKKTIIVREYQLDIGLVQVYENYLVTIFNEGVTLTLERAYQVIGIAEIHFQEKPFGFISFRQNNYAIDPTIYSNLRELENLKAFAVVSIKEMDMHNFKIEKLFFKKPMKFFIEYKNARKWLLRKLKEKSV